MSTELLKAYEPKEVERRIYDFWMQGGYFHAEPDPEKKPYTIVIPPPNITGQLHMGHALDETMQDILIRWKRMQGYSALWLPGTDHASIATEAKIVEAMRKEGITKDDIGREGFLKRLGMEGKVRRPHYRAAEAFGLLLRLGPPAFHHGRGVQPGCAPRVREAV